MSPKRKRLTLGQKKQLIADKYAGSLIDDLKKKFSIGKTAAYDTINNRKAILKQVEDGTDPKKKDMKLDENPISDATLSWFETQRSKKAQAKIPDFFN